MGFENITFIILLHLLYYITDWRLFDDSVVTRIQPSRVQSADAYLLFYKQRGSNTERVLKRNYNLDLVNVPSSSHSN